MHQQNKSKLMGKKNKEFYSENSECCLAVYIIVGAHVNIMTQPDICGELGRYTYSLIDVDV